MSEVHIVLPNDVDDPALPSGGNRYDRRLCDGLTTLGWTVREHAVYGAWPHPDADARDELAATLSGLPGGALVLVDGLVGSAVPDVLAPQADRLRLVPLVHMPLADDAEKRTLSSARTVVASSEWSRQLLLDRYALPADRVYAAPPGVDPAPEARGTPAGGALLCVAAVGRHKGYDLLVEALASLVDQEWTCTCVGSLTRDPGFVADLRRQVAAQRLADRVRLVGARTGADLEASYAAADLLVLPSRGETYGMVITEALAHGVPVLATAVGGVPEALGRAPDGTVPGLLVPSEDTGALAGAVRAWLADADLRGRLRRSARARRPTLAGWTATAEAVAAALRATA